jgi:hypothetical protein
VSFFRPESFLGHTEFPDRRNMAAATAFARGALGASRRASAAPLRPSQALLVSGRPGARAAPGAGSRREPLPNAAPPSNRWRPGSGERLGDDVARHGNEPRDVALNGSSTAPHPAKDVQIGTRANIRIGAPEQVRAEIPCP